MRHVKLVAGRELAEALRSKGYWVTMGLLLLLVAASIVLPRLLESDTSYDLGLAGDAPAGIEADLDGIAEAFDVGLTVEGLDDADAARLAVDDGEVDAALVFADDGATLVRRTQTSEALVAIAGQATVSSTARERLADEGLSPEAAQAALATPPPTEVTLDDEQPGRSGVAYATSLVLYLALFMGGLGVATGVAVDKSTRVAEVLVTTVRPAHLLAGKVLGIGLSTLLLLLAAAVPFAGAIAAGLVDVPSAAALDVLGAIGWFILGYAIYATAFAALGALVDRQEDLGGAVGPVTTALVGSYLISFQAQASPNSPLAVVASIFPFSSPMVMPIRIAEGAASPAEVIAAVVVGIAGFLLLVRVGGTIYRRALLRGGKRLKVREVLRG